MAAHNVASQAVDSDAKWLYRVGGISAILLAVVLQCWSNAAGGEAWPAYLDGNYGVGATIGALFIPALGATVILTSLLTIGVGEGAAHPETKKGHGCPCPSAKC